LSLILLRLKLQIRNGWFRSNCMFHISRIYLLHFRVPFSVSNVRLLMYRKNILNKRATSLRYLLLNTTSPLFGWERLSSLGLFVPSAAHGSIVAMARRARQTDARVPWMRTSLKCNASITFMPDHVHSTPFFHVL
jgi:hypothetical protein